MDNLLNFKQKIVKRRKAPDIHNPVIWTNKPVNGHISTSSANKNKASDKNRRFSRNTQHVIIRSAGSHSFRHNFNNLFRLNRRYNSRSLILPKQIISQLKRKLELKNQNNVRNKKIIKLKLKYVFTSGFAFIFIFGLIHSASVSSITVNPYDEVLFQKDSFIENELKALFSPGKNLNKNTEKIDLSILKGLKIIQYKVKSGDSLSKIAAAHNVSMGTIISLNKIKNAKKLYKGTVLSIPTADGIMYSVKKGDSLGKIAGKYDISFNRLLDLNDLESSLIRTGQKLFIPDASISSFELKKTLGELFLYPVKGRITSGFGYRKDPFTGRKSMHYGIDIANKKGTSVKATLDGKVLKCGTSLVYGKYIIIKHHGGYQSLYAHLNKYLVRKGQNVDQGEIIAELGNTGRSTGPHLHFSIYANQKPVDPLKQLTAY